jgi:hypothetical protein
MNSTTSVRRTAGLAAMLALMAGASLAWAQQGEFDQPLKRKATSSSTTMISESDGEHKYTLRIEGDKVTAEVDGKEVPKDRLRKRAGRYEILDQDGGVIKSFDQAPILRDLPMAVSPRFQIETLEPGAQGGFGGGDRWVTNWAQPPKVMMGVTMSDAEEGGASIDTVIDDLPAGKAGLKAGDRVTAANGKEIATQKDLRDILAKAEPGDTITLKVDRDGKDVELKVKLAKWDQEKLGVMGAPVGPLAAIANRGEHFDNAQKALEKALETLGRSERLMGRDRESVEQSIKDALKAIESARKQSSSFMLDEMHDGMRVFGQGGRTFTIPAPPAPPAVSDDLARQLERLGEQMEKLNKRMEQLEKNR